MTEVTIDLTREEDAQTFGEIAKEHGVEDTVAFFEADGWPADLVRAVIAIEWGVVASDEDMGR